MHQLKLYLPISLEAIIKASPYTHTHTPIPCPQQRPEYEVTASKQKKVISGKPAIGPVV